MASSQVEIASSSPFGYVLNRNVLQKNLKDLVQSHLHSCISNSQNHSDLWVHKTQCDKNENDMKKTNVAEKWDKARNLVLSMDKESKGDGALEVPNLGGVSSLVRKWKGFEADSKSPNMVNNVLFVESPQKGFDECDVSSIVKGDSFGDCESDKTDTDITESERLRVADIIKKLTLSSNNGDECSGRDHNGTNVVVVNGGALPRLRISSDNNAEQQRCSFSPVLNSPRFIRGRQAFSDLLLQMERQRHRELEDLVERKAVSKFQQKGRIQAMLRVRLIRRGAEVRDGRSVNYPASESNRLAHSAIIHLREKFNSVGQLGLADSRNTSKEVAESTYGSLSVPSTPKQKGERNYGRELRGPTSPQRKLTHSNSAKAGIGFSSHQQRQEDPPQGLVKERPGLQPGVADPVSTSIALGGKTRDPGTCNEENYHHKPRNPDKMVVDDNPKDGNICTSNQPQQENQHEEVSEQTSPRNVATRLEVGNGVSSRQQREGNRHKEFVVERAGKQPGVVDSTSTPKVKGENTRDTCTSNEENQHKPRNSRHELAVGIPEVEIFCISNQLREGNDYKELSEQTSSNSSYTEKEKAIFATNSGGSCRSNQNDMDLENQEGHTNLPSCTSQAQSLENFPEQASWGKISSEASHSNLLDFVESAKNSGANKQHPGTSNEWTSDGTNPQSDWEEETVNQVLIGSDSGWVSDYSQTASGWDELQSNLQQEESYEDWISDISRPRKEWEGLRQARYQEMLDPFSDNHEIQQLLQRKNVSNFLTSGLRDKIDKIMASRSQQLPKAMSRHVKEEGEPAEMAEEEEVVSQQNTRVEEIDLEEGDASYDDDSEDENRPGRKLYNEPEVLLIDQYTSSQPWSLHQDQEVTDESYHPPSTASLQSQSSNIYGLPIQQCSSSSSNEMELIYELRGQMEQLHQEIFEIRRSMNSCMNMQMKLQRSIKKDVAAAISQLGQKSLGNSVNKGLNKGNCCVCYEVPVDSLLYRCGHMCTCFKCAHELLGGTGKCPICRAPILDVVRAYAHS